MQIKFLQKILDKFRNKKKIDDLKNQLIDIKKEKDKDLFEVYIALNARNNYPYKKMTDFNNNIVTYNFQGDIKSKSILFQNANLMDYRDCQIETMDNYVLHGTQATLSNRTIAKAAFYANKPLYTFEIGFLSSADTWANKNCEYKYRAPVSGLIDSVVPYFDARYQSNLERMINDPNIVVTEEQKQRARSCIDKIVETHLTKYNHQPIYEPKIGREGVKKILVVDQSYGDMSIVKGWGSEFTFEKMLQSAIDENPGADIIVKTHPDTMTGRRGGYYTDLKPHDNIYTQTEPINPISLIKYVDKVYVCTTQFGFEALMCGKDVHTFGMPFYANWGLTHDLLKCDRRTNKRSLEEVFYLAYIEYSNYINPEKKQRCEIEEAMDYLLKLREEYRIIKNDKS